MATKVIMPALGMAQETGKLISWLKKEGDSVTRGEPIMEIEVVVPEESMGEVIGDLNARSGQIDEVGFRGGKRLVRALVPMRQLFGYSTDVRSLTQGRATFTMRFHRFDTVTKAG